MLVVGTNSDSKFNFEIQIRNICINKIIIQYSNVFIFVVSLSSIFWRKKYNCILFTKCIFNNIIKVFYCIS